MPHEQRAVGGTVAPRDGRPQPVPDRGVMVSDRVDRLASRAVFMCAFRSMFLAAAAYAALGLALWTGYLAYGIAVPTVPGGPIVWHAHEMMFGFGLAAVTGFALTAIAELTATPAFTPRTIVGFAALWLAGRVLFWSSGILGSLPAAIADVALPVALAVALGPRLLRDPERRHHGFLWPIIALAAVAAGFHVDLWRGAYPMRWVDAAIGAMMTLVLVALGRVSVRIVNDALEATHRDDDDPPRYLARPPRRNLAISAIAAATLVDLVAPGSPVGGWLALAAAAAILNILNDWHVGRALLTRYAFVLYVAVWLMAAGYAALGAAALGAGLPASAARHLLSAGVMGLTIFAVMCIAGRIHAGYALDARRWVVVVAGSIVAAAIARAASPLAGDAAPIVQIASGAIWAAAFGVTLVHLGPVWWRPRIDGRHGCDEARS